MTSKATVAEAGACCDYATCLTNLTHFPKQDAQVMFIYLVTTLIALSMVLFPGFLSIIFAKGRKALSDDCLGMCVLKVWGLA